MTMTRSPELALEMPSKTFLVLTNARKGAVVRWEFQYRGSVTPQGMVWEYRSFKDGEFQRQGKLTCQEELQMQRQFQAWVDYEERVVYAPCSKCKGKR